MVVSVMEVWYCSGCGGENYTNSICRFCGRKIDMVIDTLYNPEVKR